MQTLPILYYHITFLLFNRFGRLFIFRYSMRCSYITFLLFNRFGRLFIFPYSMRCS